MNVFDKFAYNWWECWDGGTVETVDCWDGGTFGTVGQLDGGTLGTSGGTVGKVGLLRRWD